MFTPLGRSPDPPNAHDGRSPPNRFPLRASLGLAGLLVASFFLSLILAPGFERALSFLPRRILNPGDFWDFALGGLTLVSHALVHADSSHLILNLCMVLPFAAVLETRFGPAATLRIFWGSVAAGVLTHLAVYGGSHGLMGASAGASGLLGAWMRGKVRNGWAFFALAALWIAANHPRGLGVAESVSWQAHLGGFLAGMALLPASPAPEPSRPSEASGSQKDSSSGR
ncbi:rhomboid family intramembrane serine protease [Neomegalonema perideroedes]|uniref:rhomboid family intramembrane serine protease n=1 Tax=Neomegalonema perideroedes TaxID=217219 RepID=UPI0003807018|nr:rhomboid family intramembrane serine protease [Neomegalonema perideroedes]